jgi:hypothetical protein
VGAVVAAAVVVPGAAVVAGLLVLVSLLHAAAMIDRVRTPAIARRRFDVFTHYLLVWSVGSYVRWGEQPVER